MGLQYIFEQIHPFPQISGVKYDNAGCLIHLAESEPPTVFSSFSFYFVFPEAVFLERDKRY